MGVGRSSRKPRTSCPTPGVLVYEGGGAHLYLHVPRGMCAATSSPGEKLGTTGVVQGRVRFEPYKIRGELLGAFVCRRRNHVIVSRKRVAKLRAVTGRRYVTKYWDHGQSGSWESCPAMEGGCGVVVQTYPRFGGWNLRIVPHFATISNGI